MRVLFTVRIEDDLTEHGAARDAHSLACQLQFSETIELPAAGFELAIAIFDQAHSLVDRIKILPNLMGYDSTQGGKQQ